MRWFLVAAVFVSCAACASASFPSATTIEDTSFTDAQGVRAIRFSGHIEASPADVYRAVATVAGWKTWAVPSAFGEARAGGVMETSYNRAAKAGDPANIQQEFIELVPGRKVVFHTIRTPPGFPHADLFVKTTSTIELSLEGKGTRMIFTHSGFGPGEGYDQLYGFFAEGNKSTLEKLKQRFDTGPVDWAAEQKPAG
ncbi:MAG TPA: SRPBCC domain-containing protein [Hyphomonadaceae bacterium]|jgi:uncharacterized protein YndB with AHSA1/START domain|nr:SRPBCC domain-containing protein [Hyphomonadaceae bacterium]